METDKRKEEIFRELAAEKNDGILKKLVEEAVFLESRLAEIETLPFVKVHPADPYKQKATTAGRLFVQLSAQYNSVMRTLYSISGRKDTDNEESLLRTWIKMRMENGADSEKNDMDAG